MMRKILGIILIFCLPILSIGQQTINGSIIHDGIQRDYILYVPQTYSPEISTPLVFNFHGYTSNANEQMWYGDFRSIADTAGFIIVHPMGTLDNYGITHWNVGWGTSTVDDIGFTESLIDSLALDYNINLERIFATGMSNGGFMSYTLACELSSKIAAIASVTGSMNVGQSNTCNAEHQMPVMEFHGTADGVVPYDGTSVFASIESVIDYWVNFNNCNLTPAITELPDADPNDGSTVEHYLYDEGDNGAVVEHFKILNGAHTWPGSIFGGVGTNNDIDASVEIWKFFSKYDINGLIVPTSVNPLNDNLTDINIYPNPTNSFINIELELREEVECSLLDLTGQTILHTSINNNNHKLDVSKLKRGLYILRIGNQSIKIFKTE
jgi:polyhydroxybutyrate depolymerase